ncbi:MAG: glucose 1-dehydrogenase [Actinobacteria bacterium]|nr:glucose 1-dehydrogenase [Actinomycetota bacterium]
MKAIAVEPGVADSVRVEDVETAPGPDDGLLVRTLAIGVCGTDAGIVAGSDGVAPPGEDRLIIGHESLGVVERAPDGSGFAPGDHVAGIVRRPDPVPCPCCARGEWDMCSNGRYRERGIKALHGFAATSFTVEPEFAVRVPPELGVTGVLVEPASIVAKAWRRIDDFVGRNCLEPSRVLVTGAGPIGLLAALLGAQRGFEVHVLDRVTSGPKPGLVEQLGARYHTTGVADACEGADITLECTGADQVTIDAIANSGRNGIVCLTGVSEGGYATEVDVGAINRSIVLDNDIVFGSVNANRSDYEAGIDALLRADETWRTGLITRSVPIDSATDAFTSQDGDVKTIVAFDELE